MWQGVKTRKMFVYLHLQDFNHKNPGSHLTVKYTYRKNFRVYNNQLMLAKTITQFKVK